MTDLTPADVYDRTGSLWKWNVDRQVYECADPGYDGPSAVDPGAIPQDRQPVFAHPPNEAQQIGMAAHPEER